MPTRTSFVTTYKGRGIDWSKRVEVYRNLNKKGKVYSVKQDGLVVGHTTSLDLKNCHFVVKESGRQRVLKTGRKNVHAYVVGYPVGITTDRDLKAFGPPLLGRYDLHGVGKFVVNTNHKWEEINTSMHARLDASGLTVWMPRS